MIPFGEIWIAQAVEGVALVWVACRDTGMIEVKFGTMSHAQFFHHTTRRLVRNCSDRDDLSQSELTEREVDDAESAFRRQPLTLTGLRETPANLDGRLRKIWDDIAHSLQADGSGEGAGVAQDRGEETEAFAIEGGKVAIDRLITLFGSEGSSEESHDDGVGVHRCKGRAVGLLPAAKDQARSLELKRLGQFFVLKKKDGSKAGSILI
jgi:hypothetical protein